MPEDPLRHGTWRREMVEPPEVFRRRFRLGRNYVNRYSIVLCLQPALQMRSVELRPGTERLVYRLYEQLVEAMGRQWPATKPRARLFAENALVTLDDDELADVAADFDWRNLPVERRLVGDRWVDDDGEVWWDEEWAVDRGATIARMADRLAGRTLNVHRQLEGSRQGPTPSATPHSGPRRGRRRRPTGRRAA